MPGYSCHNYYSQDKVHHVLIYFNKTVLKWAMNTNIYIMFYIYLPKTVRAGTDSLLIQKET